MKISSGTIRKHVRFAPFVALLMSMSVTCGAGSSFAGHAQEERALRDSVVNIKCKIQPREAMRPWMRDSGHGSGGSGVVIAPGRILTNAHVVNEATEVLVETSRTNLPVGAEVLAIDLGRDLALLEIKDKAFIEAHPPVELFPGIPSDGSEVVVMGYPVGGESLSVTTGVISRCEWAVIGLGAMQSEGMRIQVDAAVNFGNSGGPGFVDGKIAGLVFSAMDNAESDNISYLIATEEIQRFLREVESGVIDGNSVLHVFFQPLENPEMRRKLDVGPSVSGLLVIEDSRGIFEPWDIVTKVNGFDVGNDGGVLIEDGREVWVGAAVGRFDPLDDGDAMEVEVRRRGLQQRLLVTPQSEREGVIRTIPNGDYPYIVVGPLVFGPMHHALYDAHYEAEWEGIYFYGGGPALNALNSSAPSNGFEIVTVLCPMLSHPIGRGFDAFPGQTVKSVNGHMFKNFKEFVELVAADDGEWITFEFNETGSPRIVFSRETLLDATADVMEANGIRRASSKGFRDIWAIED